MFDLLYTKAMAFHKRRGFVLRITSILSTVTVLVLFSLSGKDSYSNTNIYVTLVLLWAAIFLEIYGLFVLLISDEAAYWLMNRRPAILDFVERLKPLYNRRRWSGCMPQYSLISFALKVEHLPCHRFLEWIRADQKFLKFKCKDNAKVSDFLKERVITYFKKKIETEGPSVWKHRGGLILVESGLSRDYGWSIELQFDHSIFVWHIATELLCHPKDREYPESLPCSDDDKNDIRLNMKLSLQLSRYMLYLLVEHPFLLPVGVGHVKFRDIYEGAMSFLNERRPMTTDRAGTNWAKWRRFDVHAACDVLRNDVNTQLAPMVAEGDKNRVTLHQGCDLASKLGSIYKEDAKKKWEILSSVWVEMLAYAAIKCKGLEHARLLPQGGQFLTHVWLLMAHFGLTNHFQIEHPPAIAELLMRRD